MKKKLFFTGYISVAFVWFTTHFGGGFASGRQAAQYFVQYGWYSLFTPAISIVLNTLVFYYAWDFAVSKKKFEYRGWADQFYQPYSKVFSNVYEVLFNLILVVATAVAFATGGATLQTALGTPALLNTIFIGIIIFFLTIYGADLVRRTASTIAVIVIVGLFVVFGSNLVEIFPNLVKVVTTTTPTASIWEAIWSAIKYASFQSATLGTYIAVADILESKKDVKKAAIWGAAINGVILMLVTIVILGHYPDVTIVNVPTLYIITNGFGGRFLELLTSGLIFLGVVSTGVNLIYGVTKRFETVFIKEGRSNKKATITISLLYIVVTWSVAQLGLIPLVAKGYGYIGYVAIPVVLIPILYKGIFKKNGISKEKQELIG